VICALLRDFRKHGEKAIAEVRRTQPASYLKVIALVLPREHQKVEHTNALSGLSDEELETMIEHLKERIAEKLEEAKVINGEAKPVEALPGPAKQAWRPRRTRKAAKALKAITADCEIST
jgi:hypothetical protein